MDMPRLLIVDGNDEFRQALVHQLCESYRIQTARDGHTALELICSFRPELIVLDPMLSGLDGITLLQRAREEGCTAKVLALLSCTGDYLQSALSKLAVSYMMVKPCDLTAVADRLADFAAELQPQETPMADLNSAVSNLLVSLGFPTRLDGFLFLQAGIPMYLRDPGQSMTKELYVAIGALYGKDGQQVERSIRSAIASAWSKGDMQVWQMYFGTSDGLIPRPTNNEFLGRIAMALAQQGYQHKSA